MRLTVTGIGVIEGARWTIRDTGLSIELEAWFAGLTFGLRGAGGTVSIAI